MYRNGYGTGEGRNTKLYGREACMTWRVTQRFHWVYGSVESSTIAKRGGHWA